MQFSAKVKFLRISPYKLRPMIDVIRGKDVVSALHWLATYKVRKVTPITKLIESAAANAYSLHAIDRADLVIADLRVDQGPIIRYFKPGAMGRGDVQRKRLSHMKVVLTKKEEVKK